MMKFFLFFFSLFLLSCSKNGKNQIIFPNEVSFSLKEREHLEAENSLHIVNQYFDFFQSEENRVPLYKTIYHSDYSLFVGLPYNIDFNSIKSKKLLSLKGELIAEKKNCNDCIYRVSKFNEQFLVQYILNVNSNLILFLGVTNKEELINEEGLLSLSTLSKRVFK